MKIFDDSMSLRRPVSRIRLDPRGWTDGEVLTPHGVVTVYAQGGPNETYHTRLDFVKDGRLYMRNLNNKRYSARGLVTLAARFADEISDGGAND